MDIFIYFRIFLGNEIIVGEFFIKANFFRMIYIVNSYQLVIACGIV